MYWSVIYPAFRGHGEGYLRHGAHDEDNHDQLYAECLAAFGHVKTDLVTTARRSASKIFVSMALYCRLWFWP